MKKTLLLLGIGLLILLVIIKFNSASSNKTVEYKLNNKIFKLLKAETPKEWEKGLMNIRKPTKIEGMIFIFPDKQIRNFWNKNTFIDLDLYWMDDDKVVGQSFLPSIEKSNKIVIVSSPEKVNRVIELVVRR